MSDVEVQPEQLGFDGERLARLGRIVQADVDAGLYDGAALQVRRFGKVAFERHIGYAELDQQTPLTAANTFCSLSLGKQFINVLVLNRVERGDLSLTMHVADLIPEFARRGKDHIQLYHLLTHTSGLTAFGPPLPPDKLGDLEAMVEAACDSVPESRPGERVHYSVLAAHAVMGEMLKRVDGGRRTLRTLMREDLFEPLGMTRTALGGPADLMATLAKPRFRSDVEGAFSKMGIEALPWVLTESFEMPGGGYVTHLEDVGRFAEMLQSGSLEGCRLLSPAMLALATRNWTGADTGLFRTAKPLRGWEPFPAAIGLGFFTKVPGIYPSIFGTLASEGSFGGAGTGTTAMWVDPARQLSFVFLSHGALEDTRHIERVQRLSDVVHSALAKL